MESITGRTIVTIPNFPYFFYRRYRKSIHWKWQKLYRALWIVLFVLQFASLKIFLKNYQVLQIKSQSRATAAAAAATTTTATEAAAVLWSGLLGLMKKVIFRHLKKPGYYFIAFF